MPSEKITLACLVAMVATVHGFGTRETLFGSNTRRPTSVLFVAPSFANRYFQLEEMEDKDASETELFLDASGVVTLGDTDGPPPVALAGTWETKDDGSFVMTLSRTFPAGHEKIRDTDVGEFEFKTERTFTGERITVGDCLAVQGSMHIYNEDGGDAQVGFFEMIDTTDERAKQMG